MRYDRFMEVAESQDIPTLRSRLDAFGQELGFGLYGMVVFDRRPDKSWTSAMVSNAPAEFADAAMDPENGRRDSVNRRAKASSVPVVYDQGLYDRDGNGDLWEEQAAFGYKTGIAVPVHLADGKRLCIGFDREEPLPKEGERLFELISDVQLLAVHVQDTLVRLLCPEPLQPPAVLTPRQLEALRWAAFGKTLWETGQILNISERTAKAHLHAALAALDCSSTPNAIYRATQMGLL